MSPSLLSNLHPESLETPLKRGAGRVSHGEGMEAVPLGWVPSLEGVHGAVGTLALFAFKRQHCHGWERKKSSYEMVVGWLSTE